MLAGLRILDSFLKINTQSNKNLLLWNFLYIKVNKGISYIHHLVFYQQLSPCVLFHLYCTSPTPTSISPSCLEANRFGLFLIGSTSLSLLWERQPHAMCEQNTKPFSFKDGSAQMLPQSFYWSTWTFKHLLLRYIFF